MAAAEQRKAVKAAFYQGRRVRVGDVVTVPADFKASWLSDAAPEPKKSSDESKGKH